MGHHRCDCAGPSEQRYQPAPFSQAIASVHAHSNSRDSSDNEDGAVSIEETAQRDSSPTAGHQQSSQQHRPDLVVRDPAEADTSTELAPSQPPRGLDQAEAPDMILDDADLDLLASLNMSGKAILILIFTAPSEAWLGIFHPCSLSAPCTELLIHSDQKFRL